MMKFIFTPRLNSISRILLLLFISLISIGGFSQTSELKLVSDIWPPFTDITGEKSISVDLVSEALSRSGIKSNVEILDFKTVIPGLESGKFDGSSALWINDERKEFLVFSEPYLHNQLILVGMKGSDISASSMDDLSGKKIGVVTNYAYGYTNTDIEIISSDSDQKNLSLLLSNKIDYMIVDAILIQYLLKYQVNDVTEFLEISKTPLMVKPLHFALNKKVKNAEEIVEKFNASIKEMIADGTYNKILELNWISADIDGDGKMELILNGNSAGLEAPSDAYAIHDQKSMAEKGTQKYYIEGQTYYGWDSVPEQYKKEIIMGSQSLKNSGITLNFKKKKDPSDLETDLETAPE